MLSGVGRSGTNALRAALSAHPALDSTRCESNIVHDLLEVALRNRTMESRRLAMRTAPEEYDRLFREMILSLLWPAPRALAPGGALAYSNLTPETAAELLRLFPGGRIVYLVRSGVEVVASRMLYPAFAGHAFEDHCRVWNRAAAVVNWAEAAGERRVIVARHERLRDDAGGEIGRILGHLELPFAEACLAPLARAHIPTHAAGEDPAAAADLSRRGERAAGWTEAQRETFQRLCGESMARIGYTTA